jgi:ligand-binding sensor domain-containing protein/signal transduction histidine kinase
MYYRKPYYFYLLVLITWCSISTAFAQRYPFYNLNVENGLIQSQAQCMVQDKFGHLWIGTLGGLSRYDGNSFNSYTVRDGMSNNTVNALAIDSTGNIWVGGPKGISAFNGKKFRHYLFQPPETPLANTVTEIKIATNNKIWCRAGGKVYYMQQDTSHALPLPDNGDGVSAILPEDNGIWAARNNGVVYHYYDKKWDSLQFNEPALQGIPHVYAMYKDSKDRIWLGTNAGLYHIANHAIRPVTINNQPVYNLPSLFSMTEDKKGGLWFGTNKGALYLKDSSFTYYNKRNGLTDNNIFSVMSDKEGNIWFASDGQGVFRFTGAQFTILDESMGLPSGQVTSIAASHGRLYLGTYDAGLYTFENGQVYAASMPIKPAPAITAICIRNGYEIWLGTRGAGLWKYDGVHFKSYTFPAIHSNFISSLYNDEQGRLWVGFNNGAMYYDNDIFYSVPVKKVAVMAFTSLSNDSVLIALNDGINEGLKLFHDGNITPFITHSTPDSAFAQCFTKNGQQLWIGTSDNGVICYDLQTKKSFTINKSNGLYSDFIYNIITDNEGNVWAGTGYGIHKISMKKGLPVIKFYGRGNGITGMESNHNAVFKMPDGSIWFGTTNGAVHYNPKSKISNPEPISVVLQSVKVFGENITDTTYYDSTDSWYKVPYALRLPPNKNNITFTFHGISLSGSEQVKYRYRIGGLDEKWTEWSPMNTITYSAMPPGNYTLNVECTSGDASLKRTLAYSFTIITPFHKTGWFKFIILMGCILLGITLQYIANVRKQNRLALMEQLRREEQGKVRQRTAEDFHDEVGNKLTRINVLTDVLKNKMGPLTPDTQRILEQIQDNTSQLYGGTRDILWSLKPSNDNLYEILHRIRDFGNELFSDTDIEFSFAGTDEKWRNYKLPMDVSRNLIMIFKEALNNSLKYAHAQHIKLEVHIKQIDALQMVLTDDGKGFDIHNYKKGHGIDNMNVRAKRIHAKLYLDSRPQKGTIINLTFRLLPKYKTDS